MLQTTLAQDRDRLRGTLGTTPIGTEVEFTLRTGDHVRGPLGQLQLTDTTFAVWVRADEEVRRQHGSDIQSVKRRFRYEDVTLDSLKHPV